MDNTIRVVLVVAVLAVMGWWYQQHQFASKLIGVWEADFPVNNDVLNAPQVKALKLVFERDGKFIYHAETFQKTSDYEFRQDGLSSSSKGTSKSTWVIEGTYQLKGHKVIVHLGMRVDDFRHVDPFVVMNFGADEVTGHSFIEAAAQAEINGSTLTLQPYKYEQKFYFMENIPYQNTEWLIQLPNPYLDQLENAPERSEVFTKVGVSQSPSINKKAKDSYGDPYQKSETKTQPAVQFYGDPAPTYQAMTPQEIAEFKNPPASVQAASFQPTDSQLREAEIAIGHYYREFLGRYAQEQEVQHWLAYYKQGESLEQIKQSLISSRQYEQNK